VHSREEEGFYIIEGQVAFHAGLVDAVLTKDSFIALPKGILHSWINTSTGHARLITFTAGARSSPIPSRRAAISPTRP
jgi:mannose-6-phosphate isomerase-like protein (cupin superfamily)